MLRQRGLVSLVFVVALLLLLQVLQLVTTTNALPSRRIAARRTLFSHHKRKQQQKKKKAKGMQLAWRRPTSQCASQIYASSSSSSYLTGRSDATNCFNHDTAGMTNPSLRIAVDNQMIMHISATTTKTSSTTSSITGSTSINNVDDDANDNDDWWPEPTTTATAASSRNWRVMDYRRSHVGWGRDCYEAVRDKVLAWEFDWNHQGIVALHDNTDHIYLLSPSLSSSSSSSSSSLRRQQQNQQQNRQQQQLMIRPFHRTNNNSNNDDGDSVGIPAPVAVDDNPSLWHSTPSALSIGDRPRLATYARRSLAFGMSIWILNPVQVVYDWVDQRGPSATYTSTAYATCQGHGLQGEERITVALRDSGRVDIQLVSYSKAAKWYTKISFGAIRKMQDAFFTNQLQFLQHIASETTASETTACCFLEQQQQDGMTLPLLAKPMTSHSSNLREDPTCTARTIATLVPDHFSGEQLGRTEQIIMSMMKE